MNERNQIMRAKEYIACSEASLKHPAEIRQIIDEMLPLRSSRQQTVDYYNRKLIADIRLQACLLQKELYTIYADADLDLSSAILLDKVLLSQLPESPDEAKKLRKIGNLLQKLRVSEKVKLLPKKKWSVI